MSYSISAQGTRDEVLGKIQDAFESNYHEPAPGVAEAVGQATEFVASFTHSIEDSERFSVSINGHANQGEDDSSRDSITVSIQPIT